MSVARYATPKPCPGCGIEYSWSREQIVPSNRQLGEPDGVGIRYLMIGVRGMFKPVHKCPVPSHSHHFAGSEEGEQQ